MSLLPNATGILAPGSLRCPLSLSMQLPLACPLPPPAHRLIQFLVGALHKHDLIFTKANARHVEQWVELVVRFYLHDHTTAQRRKTYAHLQAHQAHVKSSIDAVFRFEAILRNNKRTERMVQGETALLGEWKTLEQHLRSLGARKERRRGGGVAGGRVRTPSRRR